MIRRIVLGLLMGLIVCLAFSCKKKEMPLDSEEFKWLLLDMHKVDGTLAVGRGMYGHEEKKNYAYYNELFKKYGITREEFDSCLYFYSAQTKEFSQMYDFIIDSLNKQLTAADKVVKELKANDSVNYFPQKIDAVALDTISLDSVVVITLTVLYQDYINSAQRSVLILFRRTEPEELLRIFCQRIRKILCM